MKTLRRFIESMPSTNNGPTGHSDLRSQNVIEGGKVSINVLGRD